HRPAPGRALDDRSDAPGGRSDHRGRESCSADPMTVSIPRMSRYPQRTIVGPVSVEVTRSVDPGQTWSAPTVVAHHRVNRAALARLEDNEWDLPTRRDFRVP